jgi:hypothetical protein
MTPQKATSCIHFCDSTFPTSFSISLSAVTLGIYLGAAVFQDRFLHISPMSPENFGLNLYYCMFLHHQTTVE